MRKFAYLLTLLSLLLPGVPVQAADARPPGHKAGHYVRCAYPSQMTYGPLENGRGSTGTAPAGGESVTLPFIGPHDITSIFAHGSPDCSSHCKTRRCDV